MEYHKLRPWIVSAAAFAFFVAALWYSAPPTDGPPGSRAPVISPNEGPPPAVSPARSNSEGPTEPIAGNQPETEVPQVNVPENQPEPPESPPQAVERSIESLKELVKLAIASKDTAAILESFVELQSRGPEGVEAAASLLDLLLAPTDSEVDFPRSAPPAGWPTLESWLHLFTPPLVEYVVEQVKPLRAIVEIFCQIHLMDWWDYEERVRLSGELLLKPAGDGESRDWVLYCAVLALQHLPGSKAADYATKFLELPPVGDTERARYGAVWVVARRGSDADWVLLEHLNMKDPAERVRGTAKYHLLARGCNETGVLVVDLTNQGTAAAAGVKTGDVIKSANGKAVEYMEDMPSGEGRPLRLEISRQGAVMEIDLESGHHGISGYHVPPAFHK